MSDLRSSKVESQIAHLNKHIKFKDVKKSIFLSALFFLSLQFGYSQIESVDYSLRYNSKTCLFDCYIIVNKGNLLMLEIKKKTDRHI